MSDRASLSSSAWPRKSGIDTCSPLASIRPNSYVPPPWSPETFAPAGGGFSGERCPDGECHPQRMPPHIRSNSVDRGHGSRTSNPSFRKERTTLGACPPRWGTAVRQHDETRQRADTRDLATGYRFGAHDPKGGTVKAAVAAALAISIFTAVNAQSAHDAPVRDAAVVKQLKKLNRAAAANQTELRQINNTLGVKGSVLEPNTAMDWLGDIERNTLNTCRAVAQYQYSECPDY